MRIPRSHDLTLAYCAQFGLPMRPFVMGNPKGLVFVGGQRMTADEATTRPGATAASGAGGGRARAHRRRALGDRHRRAAHDGRHRRRRPRWADIERRFDDYSLYDFLREQGCRTAPSSTTRCMNFLESDMHDAFMEVLREDLGGAYADMQTIAGGMDALPHALFARAPGRGPARRGGARHRPGPGRRDGPLQDRGGPGQRARATTWSAPCRSRCCGPSR